jgi:flagellar basal-body rod protein FlgB
MSVIHLFDLASQQARWLSARHIAVASNIANANTPGECGADHHKPTSYRCRSAFRRACFLKSEGHPWEVSHSGNSVSLEQELLKSGEVMSAYSLNRAITKAFGQMLMMSVKG